MKAEESRKVSGAAALSRSPSMAGLGVVATLALGSACSNFDRFDTKGDAAYCGEIVGSPGFQEGFLPRAVPPRLGLRLELDASALRSRPEEPIVVGRLNTNDASYGLCSGSGRPLLPEAPMRTIPTLDNDPLSLLEFGDGRDHNFFSWVDSSCQGTLLALTSLMRNDDVEVRLLKPAALPSADAGPEELPGFALFHLRRHDEGCGF